MREEDKHIADKLLDLISKYFIMSDADKRKVMFHVTSSFLQFPHWGQLLMILAPDSGCGKTNLRNLVTYLVPNPIKCVDPSPAALYTMLTQAQELGHTAHSIIDEAGKYYNGKRDTSLMTTIISSGVRPGEPVPRVHFPNGKREIELLQTFGNKVLCGQRNEREGFFPVDFWRRAHVVNLRLKDTSGLVKFIDARVRRECVALKAELEAWAQPRRKLAHSIEPEWIPLSGSMYDKTETLYTTGVMLDLQDDQLKEFTPSTPFTTFTGARGVGKWAQSVLDDAKATLESVRRLY
jgi:hypothetical protein